MSINVKMLTIVGFLTFISRINKYKIRVFYAKNLFQHFSFMRRAPAALSMKTSHHKEQ